MDFDFESEIDAKDVLRKASLKELGHSANDSANARGKHNLVCRHWIKSLCMKGDKCPFLHVYDPNKMPECNEWNRTGKCTDPNCVLRHVDPSERPLCQRYRVGFCRFGPLCRSRHDRFPPEELPDLLPDYFIDSLLLNPDLVPRAEEVKLGKPRDGPRRGGSVSDLALVPLDATTEQGTIPGLPPPIHGKCRYFMVRSMITRNVQISIAKGIWATSHGNTSRLRQAFRDMDHVILIFMATESRQFHGYARIVCEPDDRLLPGVWGDNFSRLGPNFRVHWLKQCGANGSSADHIKNPQDDDLPVRRCRDGQELPSSVGEILSRFLWQQPYHDLLKGSELEFESRVDYSKPQAAAIKDAEPAQSQDRKAKPKPDKNAPLALEDQNGKKEKDPSRPAPAHMGTFSRDVISRRSYRDGPAAAPLGRPLVSKSSSLMAALNEDSRPRDGAGWRPPPVDPHGMPPPGYPAHPMGYPPHPGYFPPPGFGYPPYGATPPGFGAPPQQFSQPPADWHGASHSVGTADDSRRRSRSRRKKHRR